MLWTTANPAERAFLIALKEARREAEEEYTPQDRMTAFNTTYRTTYAAALRELQSIKIPSTHKRKRTNRSLRRV